MDTWFQGIFNEEFEAFDVYDPMEPQSEILSEFEHAENSHPIDQYFDIGAENEAEYYEIDGQLYTNAPAEVGFEDISTSGGNVDVEFPMMETTEYFPEELSAVEKSSRSVSVQAFNVNAQQLVYPRSFSRLARVPPPSRQLPPATMKPKYGKKILRLPIRKLPENPQSRKLPEGPQSLRSPEDPQSRKLPEDPQLREAFIGVRANPRLLSAILTSLLSSTFHSRDDRRAIVSAIKTSITRHARLSREHIPANSPVAFEVIEKYYNKAIAKITHSTSDKVPVLCVDDGRYANEETVRNVTKRFLSRYKFKDQYIARCMHLAIVEVVCGRKTYVEAVEGKVALLGQLASMVHGVRSLLGMRCPPSRLSAKKAIVVPKRQRPPTNSRYVRTPVAGLDDDCVALD